MQMRPNGLGRPTDLSKAYKVDFTHGSDEGASLFVRKMSECLIAVQIEI